MTPIPTTPPYLLPYQRASEKHGGSFPALRWSDIFEQEIRFQAIMALMPITTNHLLDIGCGRADFYKYLNLHNYKLSRYTGVEAIPALADTAKQIDQGIEIIEADFVKNPEVMFCAAEVLVCSGSLNTLREKSFLATIKAALSATDSTLIFNFLCSPEIATAPWICWHELGKVLDFCRGLTSNVRMLDDYRDGDVTIALRK
ncbi:MAG: hypothetical protein V4689_05400 [Verrucomicrobiota bacterium]